MITQQQAAAFIQKKLDGQGLAGRVERSDLVRITMKDGRPIGAVYLPNLAEMDDLAAERALESAYLEAITAAGTDPKIRRRG